MVLARQNYFQTKMSHLISVCKNYSQTLNGYISQNSDVLQWFQQFCKQLSNIIICICDINQSADENKIEKNTKDVLILYCTQLLTALSLLINVFVKESDINHVLTEARSCALKQIVWCLSGIEDTLITKTESVLDPSGNFIKWMDTALEKIAEVYIEEDNNDIKTVKRTCQDAKLLFEEVLSHAMSIAQVALKDDCKILKGSSQSVLDALESLADELNKEQVNSAMINLFVDTCSDKLCALENKVNTAVLKLSLKVFSEFTITLDRIDDYCIQMKTNDNNDVEQLDLIVADFDLHVDQIMQIGLFAVSCSTCTNRCVKIRSCLASLEALESELVPAFTAAFLDSCTHNVNYALLLKSHWINQANMLRQFIYLIIDPFAFCQVIHEECKQLIATIPESSLKKNVERLISYSEVLKSFINTVANDIDETNIKKVKDTLNDFTNVLHEVKSARNILLNNEKETNDSNQYNRMLKRCKILLTTIKRLWYSFAEEDNVQKENKTDTSTNVKADSSNQFLDHIIKRGQQILKDRSVLYRSSIQSKDGCAIIEKLSIFRGQQNKSIPLSKLVHLRKLSFMNSMIKNENTVDLQITEILNELTNLSNTNLN